MIVLITTCTLCLLYLLWRRADILKTAVSHQCEKTFLLLFNRYTLKFEYLTALCLCIQIKNTDEQ